MEVVTEYRTQLGYAWRHVVDVDDDGRPYALMEVMYGTSWVACDAIEVEPVMDQDALAAVAAFVDEAHLEGLELEHLYGMHGDETEGCGAPVPNCQDCQEAE